MSFDRSFPELEGVIVDDGRRLGWFGFVPRARAQFELDGCTYEATCDGFLWRCRIDEGTVLAHRDGEVRVPERATSGGVLKCRSRWFSPAFTVIHESGMFRRKAGSIRMTSGPDDWIVVDIDLELPAALRAFLGWFALDRQSWRLRSAFS